MRLPAERGPLSRTLFEALRGGSDLPGPAAVRPAEDLLADEDVQISLYACQQLHYGGFDDVDDRYEWDPRVIGLRRRIEDDLEQAVRDRVKVPDATDAAEVPRILAELLDDPDSPPLSTYIQREATGDQFRELLVHRSLYHLHEADPHTFVIPRLSGRPKAALIEIQLDEYGGGRLPRMHAELFRTTMRHAGLETGYGAYVDRVPAPTLAMNNVLSTFALNRRLRGARTPERASASPR